jgi:hypothetical protein
VRYQIDDHKHASRADIATRRRRSPRGTHNKRLGSIGTWHGGAHSIVVHI